MGDERGLTVAGENFEMPEFTTVKLRRRKGIVAPEVYELDLDSTQVAAGRSFLSSESRTEASWADMPARNCSEGFSLENTINYPLGSNSHHVGC